MAARRLKLGVIGAGLVARKHHLPALKRLNDLFEIAAVASRGRNSAEALAALAGNPPVYDSYADLLAQADIEAVSVLVPTGLNLEVATAAARAGKPILLEKPVAVNLEQARQVIALESRYGVPLMIAENWRYAPEVALARKLLTEGLIGRPFMLHFVAVSAMLPDNAYANTPWRAHPKHPGGFLSDGGVHQIDALRQMGGDVTRVHALARQVQPFTGAEDTLTMNLEFASGLIGHFTLCFAAPERESQGMRVYGDRGTLAVTQNKVRLWPYAGGEQVFEAPGSGFDGELRAFYDLVVHGTPTEMTATEGFKDLAVIVTALKSAQSGQVERVEEV